MFVMHIVRNKTNVVVTTLFLMFLLLLLIAATDAMDFILPIIKQLFVILYGGLCCYYILRYVITTFTYSLIHDDFIIRKKLGKRMSTVLQISADSIEYVGKKQKMNSKYRNLRSQNMTVKLFRPNSYVVVFKTQDGYKKIDIEYDKELIMVFKKTLGKKVNI